MASTDATALPIKNQAYRITFPILDADGDLVTAATGLDSEVSKDGGTFADCTSEAVEIATSSGMYYLDLSATEMNADTVALLIKTSSSGAKTTPIVLFPAEAADVKVNVVAWNGTAVAVPTLAGVPSVDLVTWKGAGPNALSGAYVEVDVERWRTVLPNQLTAALNVKTDVEEWLGTAAATPTVAGVPEVDATHIKGVATTATLDTIKAETLTIAGLAGSTGVVVAAASKTGYALSAAGVQAIWDALTAALTTASSIGKLIVDNLNATITSRSTVTTAQVNTEVVDALSIDTYGEPAQGAPSASESLATKISYLYKAWRNRQTQTSTEYALYSYDEVTKDQKAAVTDDGSTFNREEMRTGL